MTSGDTLPASRLSVMNLVTTLMVAAGGSSSWRSVNRLTRPVLMKSAGMMI